MAKKDTAPQIVVRPDALKGQSMIITGEIEGLKRKEAAQILVDAGATIEKSLNKKVQLVVLGADAGPSKMEQIEKLGLETKDWNDLIEEIKDDGGDEPANAPADDDEESEDEEEKEAVDEKPKRGKAAAKANTKAKATPAPKAKGASKSTDSNATTTSSSSSKILSDKTVLITGTVSGQTRDSANAIAIDAGATIAKSLNKSVSLVILGTNPGPDKLAKIEDLGIETMKWAELCEKVGIEAAPEKKVAHVEEGEAPDTIEGTRVVITGTVEGQTRASAQKLLEGAGAKFAKSLNKDVELVVLGTKPGPDKLNKIAELGIQTCSFEALVEKLGLESESEPPKKRAKRN